MKYKCIIFDCDGVLVDSEHLSDKVLIDMAKPLGLDIDPSYAARHFSGKSLKYCFDHIEEKSGKKLPADFEKRYRQKTFEVFKTNLQPIPGIHQLLDRINIPFCVASSGPLEKINLNLTITNIIDKFRGKIFSAYEIKKWKPDPGVFLYAAKTMGFQPSECVVIEDSMAGVEAANAGGFDVFAFVNNGHENIFKNKNATVFRDMNRLDDLLISQKQND